MSMTEEARAEAIEKAIAAYEESSAKEAIPLPYKDGKEGPFRVIKVPVDAVVFNPKSHRVNAQLESHPKREIVAEDPFSDEAQQVIHDVLAETDGFEALKVNLEEHGQADAGVVTRGGLMVNANTRLAALRELDPQGYIKAAVLPSDADESAIDLLELALQMQPDLKQKYTFPNELWFIDDLFKYGYSSEEIAKKLNWAPSNDERLLKKGIARVDQSTRIWSMLRSIQLVSGNVIPLTFFDDKKQILIDLDDRYEAMKASDPVGAERMKEARLVGLLAQCDYRDLRKIDGDSSIETLLPNMQDSELFGDDTEALTAAGADEEGDELEGEDDADLLAGGAAAEDRAESVSFEPLIELLAGSYDKDDVILPSGDKQSRDKFVDEVTLIVETTAEQVRNRDKDARTVRGPVKALEEALNGAKTAAKRFEVVSGEADFDHGKYRYLAKKLRIQLQAIEEAIKQHEE